MKNRQCLSSPAFNPLTAQLTSLNPSHVAWTRDCLDSLTIGGKWIIPRSGTIVGKLSDSAVTIIGPESDCPILTAYIKAAGYEIKFVFVRNEKTV